MKGTDRPMTPTDNEGNAMPSTHAPGRPVLVVTKDAALQQRIQDALLQLPLDAPGLPDPSMTVLTHTAEEASRRLARGQQAGDSFGMAITDHIRMATVLWSVDPGLLVLLVGIPDAHLLDLAPPDQLLVLPTSPHPVLLKQAVLNLAARAAAEQSLRASMLDLHTRLAEAQAAEAAAREGGVQALAALLEVLDPDLAERAERIADIALHTAESIGLTETDGLRIAARMSMLGQAGLSAQTREKIHTGAELEEEEERARRLHTRTGHRILSQIPGTASAAELLSLQAPDRSGATQRLHPRRQIEATILRLALEIDARVCAGLVPVTAAEDIAAAPPPGLRAAVRDVELMTAIHSACLTQRDVRIEAVRVAELRPGMILYADVHTARGALLVSKNQEVQPMLIQRLKRFAAGVGIQEPVQVLVPVGRRRISQQRAG